MIFDFFLFGQIPLSLKVDICFRTFNGLRQLSNVTIVPQNLIKRIFDIFRCLSKPFATHPHTHTHAQTHKHLPLSIVPQGIYLPIPRPPSTPLPSFRLHIRTRHLPNPISCLLPSNLSKISPATLMNNLKLFF